MTVLRLMSISQKHKFAMDWFIFQPKSVSSALLKIWAGDYAYSVSIAWLWEGVSRVHMLGQHLGLMKGWLWGSDAGSTDLGFMKGVHILCLYLGLVRGWFWCYTCCVKGWLEYNNGPKTTVREDWFRVYILGQQLDFRGWSYALHAKSAFLAHERQQSDFMGDIKYLVNTLIGPTRGWS